MTSHNSNEQGCNLQALTPTVSTVSQVSWMGPETMTFLGYVQEVGYRIYF